MADYCAGDTIKACVHWTNNGAVAFSPKFRLRIYRKTWLIDQTIAIGTWKQAEAIEPGSSGDRIVTAILPSTLTAGSLYEGYIDCKVGTQQRDAVVVSPADIYCIVRPTKGF